MLVYKLKHKIKYLTESFYKFIYVRLFIDNKHIYEKESSKFNKLNFDEKKSEVHLNKIINNSIDRDYNSDLDSVHWKLFSAISLETKKYNKILEIGTYDGQFTSFLSKMFPKSLITTVDLPDNDPLLKKFYNRSSSENHDKYINKQKKNTNYKNIKTIKTNTFFLNEMLEPNQKFDLIWVDGGHLYPEIAWDLCVAYNLLNKDGYLLCDDVIFTKKLYKSDYVSSESSEVLSYLEERIDNSFVHFLKRTCPKRYALKSSRKYVSILKK